MANTVESIRTNVDSQMALLKAMGATSVSYSIKKDKWTIGVSRVEKVKSSWSNYSYSQTVNRNYSAETLEAALEKFSKATSKKASELLAAAEAERKSAEAAVVKAREDAEKALEAAKAALAKAEEDAKTLTATLGA